MDPTNHQILRLTPEAELDDGQPTCDTVDRNNETWYLCHGQKSFLLVVRDIDRSNNVYFQFNETQVTVIG